MTHSTLDILLINDPSSGTDKTGEWESQCDIRNAPKIKFPLKLKGDVMIGLNVDFKDPVIEEPKVKEKEKNKNEVKVVTLTGKKNKDKDKNKLF
jgi:hypothetical protein